MYGRGGKQNNMACPAYMTRSQASPAPAGPPYDGFRGEPPVPKPEQMAEPALEHAENADVKMANDDDKGGMKKIKPWFKRKAPESKIPRRIRKRRQNARLKNVLAPKNAMMVLHELHPELKMTVLEHQTPGNQTGFTVEIEIDGVTHRGMGMSKVAAKSSVSESALKAILLKKLAESNTTPAHSAVKKDDEDVTMTALSQEHAEGGENGSGGSENGSGGSKPRHTIPEDEVPWGNLASFALYKLFAEWQSQGFQVPAVTGLPNPPPNKAVFPTTPAPVHAPTPMKKIPEDAHTKHPVQLLSQLRPGCQYVENREGIAPNLTFTFSVVLDDLTFKGFGSNKKDAKKQCAKHALEHLGVVYED